VSSFTSLEDSDATVEGAFDAVNHNQWLHLACHGKPNKQKPFESSFATRDGSLMIKDIIRSNWRNLEFAFLSACHTTVGDEKSPDESIHLAAAMQFRSVIGSMWSVDDEVAQEVVSAFYGNLVDGSGRLDCTRTAMALHKAVKKLQRNNVPLEQQIVFVQVFSLRLVRCIIASTVPPIAFISPLSSLDLSSLNHACTILLFFLSNVLLYVSHACGTVQARCPYLLLYIAFCKMCLMNNCQ
jgi:hypothetical protein